MKIFKTKSILFAIATAMVVLTSLPILQSCSDEFEATSKLDGNSPEMSINAYTEVEMISLINKHIFLNGDIYSLRLKLDDALSEGISSNIYYQTLEVIENTNTTIKSIRREGKVKLELVDPQNIKIQFKTTRFKVLNPEQYFHSFTMNCSRTLTESGLYQSSIGTIQLSGSSNYMITIFAGEVKTGFGNTSFAFQPKNGVQTILLNANPCGFRVSCATNSGASNVLLVSYSD